MDTPNLDASLSLLETARTFSADQREPEMSEPARTELTALKQRCEDLELMLRWLADGPGGSRRTLMPYGNWKSIKQRKWGFYDHGAQIISGLVDDGTGLPLLTAETRAALRGAK